MGISGFGSYKGDFIKELVNFQTTNTEDLNNTIN